MAYLDWQGYETQNRILTCHILKNRFDKNGLQVWTNTADNFVQLLKDHSRQLPVSWQDYQNADKDRQQTIKDIGGFIGADLENHSRAVKKRCLSRDFLTVDLDHAESAASVMNDLPSVAGDSYYIVYSTISHTEAAPRLRVIIPLRQSITPEEYAALARAFIHALNYDAPITDPATGKVLTDGSTGRPLTVADAASCRPKQFMYWPCCCSDVKPVFEVHRACLFDSVAFMKTYPDPDAEKIRQQQERGKTAAAAEAERTAQKKARLKDNSRTEGKSIPDYIGAFNITYTVLDVIERFNLPYEVSYKLSNGNYLLEYLNGSAAGGVYYYPAENLLYTFHTSGPDAGPHCLSPFELVRIHKFGGTQSDTTTGLQDMAALCAEDDAVISNADENTQGFLQRIRARKQETLNDFEDLNNEDSRADQRGPSGSQQSSGQQEQQEQGGQEGKSKQIVGLEALFNALPKTTPAYMAGLWAKQEEGDIKTGLHMFYDMSGEGHGPYKETSEPLVFRGLTVNTARTSGGKTMLQTALLTYLMQSDPKIYPVMLSLEESEPAMYCRIMANYAASYQYEQRNGPYWTNSDAVSIKNVKQWLNGQDIKSFDTVDGQTVCKSDDLIDVKRDLLERSAAETARRLQVVSNNAFADALKTLKKQGKMLNDVAYTMCSANEIKLIDQFIRYRRKQITDAGMKPVFFIDYTQKIKSISTRTSAQWELIKAIMDVIGNLTNEGTCIFMSAQMNRDIAKEARNDKWAEFLGAYCEQAREGADIEHVAEMMLYSTIFTDPDNERHGKMYIKTLKYRSGTKDLYAMADVDFNSVFADLQHWQAPNGSTPFRKTAAAEEGKSNAGTGKFKRTSK